MNTPSTQTQQRIEAAVTAPLPTLPPVVSDHWHGRQALSPAVDTLPSVWSAYVDLMRGTDSRPLWAQRDTLTAWVALARHSVKYADHLRTVYRVRETDDAEPYATPADMFADIQRGQFIVSRANCDHPIWDESENVSFRIVHDIMGHGRSGGQFDWQGELLACGAHVPLLDDERARLALYVECIMQTGYAIANGSFGPQTVGLNGTVRRLAASAGWVA